MRNKLTTSILILGLAAAARLANPPPSAVAAEPAARPTRSIVLVHGAFADGSSWDGVVRLLQAKGYTTVAVHQPLTSLADDVAATRRAIDAQRGQVILVGHSYGGAVITQAGNDAKVAGLVYVAAFAPDAGESINDLGKGAAPPAWVAKVKVADGFLSLPPDTVAADFAQDLRSADLQVLTSKQGPIFGKNFDDKVGAAAWKTKPVWYVRAASDHMIDPRAQAGMAQRMKATVTSVDASHVVMLSHPKQVAAVILEAAAAATATAQR